MFERLADRARRLANSRLALIGLLAASAVVYAWRLGDAPIAVSNDESHFAFHSYSLATTGRDLNGVRFPMFVEMTDPLLPEVPGTAYWQPFLFYLTAAFLTVLPLTEWSIRLPVVLVALVSIALMYAVVVEAYGKRWLALIAAALLALSPSLFIMSRQAIDYVCPVPFGLGWLWCLARYLRTGSVRSMAGAGLVLACTALAHISGWALVPIRVVITLAALAYWRRLDRRTVAAFAIGLAAPAAFVAGWLAAHPIVAHELFARYGIIYDERWARYVAQTSLTVSERVSLFWDYFNPSFLFFAGGSHPTQTTSHNGVFLLPLAVLLPLGLLAYRWRPQSLAPAVVLCFLAAPLPVVLVFGALSEYSIGRAITLVPFGVLIAAHGVDWLAHRDRVGRIALAVLLIFLPVQFAPFLKDYFGDYQIRAAARFDQLNTRSVAEYAIARASETAVPTIYLSDDDRDSKAVRWRFHLWKTGHRELWDKTRYLTTVPAEGDVAIGSLLVFFPGDSRAKELLGTGRYSLVKEILQPSGEPASIVLLRQ